MVTFGYEDLFAGRRVIVFSLTNYRTLCSVEQLEGFMHRYDWFKQHGIDDIYAVDSSDWLVGPWLDKRRVEIKGLPDRDMKFVRAVADHYDYKKDTVELARLWQYVVIINDGVPEKLWHNPFKANAPLVILKDQKYRYRKISAGVVQDYLVDNQT